MATEIVCENPSKIYVGDVGTIFSIDCGQDVSAATSVVLKVRKPDGTEVEWPAEVHNLQYIRHVAVFGDLDQVGYYYCNPYLESLEWNGRGDTLNFRVYGPYE